MKPTPWLLVLLSATFLTACTADKEAKVMDEKTSTSEEPVVEINVIDESDDTTEGIMPEGEIATIDSEENTLEDEDDDDEDDDDTDDEDDADDDDGLEDDEDDEDEEDDDDETATQASTLIEETPTAVSGQFSYDTTYQTPKGMTDMKVTFEVNDGVISQVDLEGNPQHQLSLQYQALYDAKIDDFVVGKTLEEVAAVPSEINGSSLTSAGFNEAIAQLKAEA